MPKPLPGATRAKPTAGRPRSADASQSACTAALELAYEGGVPFATVERIAERSGVAKTTLYRRWPNAACIVMDAFLADMSPEIGYRRTASVEESFVGTVQQLISALKGRRGDLLRHLLGEAQSDARLLKAFVDNWISPRRAQAMAVIAEARDEGELAPDIDADALVDSIYGAVYYRLMMPYKKLSAEHAEKMVRQVFEGVAGHRRP